MNLLGTLGRRLLGIVLAIGLMLLQNGYCPMSANGATGCGMAAMPCCHTMHVGGGHGQMPGSDNHHTGGMCLMACCTIMGTLPGTTGYQIHLVRGETHVAWTVPQLESWDSGVILRPPRV